MVYKGFLEKEDGLQVVGVAVKQLVPNATIPGAYEVRLYIRLTTRRKVEFLAYKHLRGGAPLHPNDKSVVLTFASESSDQATTDTAWVSGKTSGYKVRPDMFYCCEDSGYQLLEKCQHPLIAQLTHLSRCRLIPKAVRNSLFTCWVGM